jgi:hypothetical protein
MVLWADHVYIRGGSDRVAEDLWGHLAAFGARLPEGGRDAWVKKVFNAVRAWESEQRNALRKRLEQEFTNVQSAWDRSCLERYDSDDEAVSTNISLIVSCNIFVRGWEQYCSTLTWNELQVLYEIGQNLARRNNFGDRGVGFPGSWRFHLGYWLEAFKE